MPQVPRRSADHSHLDGLETLGAGTEAAKLPWHESDPSLWLCASTPLLLQEPGSQVKWYKAVLQ